MKAEFGILALALLSEVEISQPLHTIPLVLFKSFDTLHDLKDIRGDWEDYEENTYLCRTFIRIPLNTQLWGREARTSDGMATGMAITAGIFKRHVQRIKVEVEVEGKEAVQGRLQDGAASYSPERHPDT